MDDEAILASLDSEPDAFAVLYRRHVGRLLGCLEDRFDDPEPAAAVCAETFAAALEGAHRFDPQHGSAADWLDGIARRLVARAEHRGGVEERARRRLGMAPLAAGESFERDLEEELVAAARFRASRRHRRAIARPRVPGRAALGGLASLALIAAVATLASGGGGDGDATRAATAPSGFVMRLAPMLPTTECPGLVARDEPAAEAMPDLALLTYRPHRGDELARDAAGGLPLATFDRSETRLARDPRLRTRIHVVPSLGVSDDTSCAPDDGPGVCLVLETESVFRCFRLADVRAAQALARTPDGLIVGIVPDAIGRVILSAGGRSESVRVADNVYEADLGVPSGTEVGIEVARPDQDDCTRTVAPGLLARNATLRRPAPQGMRLPPTASEAIRTNRWDAIVEDGARYWGRAGELDVWVVPVVPFGSERCAPAAAACAVVLTDGERADAECALPQERGQDTWRLTPFIAGHASIYGIVRDGVVGARVTIGGQTAEVGASDNVLAGVLPFPYRDTASNRVELIRRPVPSLPRVGLVDAGGDVEAAIERLQAAGYELLGTIVPGVHDQPSTVVHWRPRQATKEEARGVAYAVGAGAPVRIAGSERTPRPVLDSAAPVVVVVGG